MEDRYFEPIVYFKDLSICAKFQGHSSTASYLSQGSQMKMPSEKICVWRTARHYSVQKDRAMPSGAETARRYGVQRNRATSRGAEGQRDATTCRGTTRRHVVQRDCALWQRAEEPRDASWCRGTARRYNDRETRDTTWCRGTARRYNVQINRA